jgi:predicted HTH transcriptional regulator
MDKEYIIELTKKLYRLTILFPKKEPLRYKIRDLATEILAKPDEQDFEILNSFFEVAVAQNWVNSADILAIKSEYDKLRREIISIRPEKKKAESDLRPLFVKNLADRQEKILGILKEKGRAQVWEMKQIFPQVSKRTLRRDFEFLLKQGAIERFGEKNNTFYQVKTA